MGYDAAKSQLKNGDMAIFVVDLWNDPEFVFAALACNPRSVLEFAPLSACSDISIPISPTKGG